MNENKPKFVWKRGKRVPEYTLRKCEECRKYSRKTFYCSKFLKVLDINKPACEYWAPRRITRSTRTRKLMKRELEKKK